MCEKYLSLVLDISTFSAPNRIIQNLSKHSYPCEFVAMQEENLVLRPSLFFTDCFPYSLLQFLSCFIFFFKHLLDFKDYFLTILTIYINGTLLQYWLMLGTSYKKLSCWLLVNHLFIFSSHTYIFKEWK